MNRLATFFALMAFLSYGSFKHPPGQCNVTFHFDALQNEGEQVVAYKARADIVGKLITQLDGSEGQADLTAQINALYEAYVDGGDLVLVLNDGSPSPNSIIAANTIGGTRITKAPSFPDGGASQYATQRDFLITIEAEIPTLLGQTALWSWEEKLYFIGNGGPATDVIDCVQGAPVYQTLRQQTAATAVQEGRAVGYLNYWPPLFNAPIWPSLELQQLRFAEMGSPKRSNLRLVKWPSMWRYTFKSADPLTGVPTPWPI